MKAEAELRRLDLVLLGDFNPKIFSPDWLASQDLIRKSEADQSEVILIHPDIAAFKLPWCHFQVQRERMAVYTEEEPYFKILGELIESVFSLLIHTPIHSLGLNWGYHSMCDSDDEWHNFGYFLAPKDPWKDIIDESGMLTVEVTEKIPPEDPLTGKLTVRVKPSGKFPNSIFVNFHDHYQLPDIQKVIGCNEILDTLKNNFEKSKEKSENMLLSLFENFDRSQQ